MFRNIIFSITFFIGIIIISIIFLPALFFPQKVVLFGGKLMGYWTELNLRFFLSTKIEIKGRENIIQNEKFFIFIFFLSRNHINFNYVSTISFNASKVSSIWR